MNEVTQNYPADYTHPTYIDRRIARELFIILEKYVSGGIDTSEGQTLWSDSNRTSDALSEDNDFFGSRPTGHNTATGSSSYDPSFTKAKRKSILEQFSKITMQRIYECQDCEEKLCSNWPKIQDVTWKVWQIVKALERDGTIEKRHTSI